MEKPSTGLPLITSLNGSVSGAHLRVDIERQHQNSQQQVGHSQADDEVVGGSFEGALREHTQTHQDISQDYDQDERHP